MEAHRNNYEINVTETKTRYWKKLAFDTTVRFDTKVSDLDSYLMEHSPIREEEYCIEMKNIPTFVSVHFVRHNVGVKHYVLSNRNDRGGDDKDGRWTPVNHTMFLNSEALITLASKRLCRKSHQETRYIMWLIKEKIKEKNYELSRVMVPMCVRRNGICKELKNTCGMKDKIMQDYSYYKELFER